MRQLTFAIATAATAWSVAACRPAPARNLPDAGPTVDCSIDPDCTAALDGGNCVNGVCVFCTQAQDCVAGKGCVNGTCVSPDAGSGGTSAGGTGGTSGGKDGGLPPGQCVTSCDCSSAQACVSGRCASPPSGACQRNNDCTCSELCSAGSCAAKCKQNSDCPTASPFCYLPQGQCGPCTNSAQCPSGQVCSGGMCQTSQGSGCNATHCCNNGDCPRSAPVCSSGSCGACTSTFQCSQGYTCLNGSCELPGGGSGACGAGCTGGLVCEDGGCVTTCCTTPCGPPSVCDEGNSCTCICPANCGGSCPSGTTCDTSSCQCVPATSGGSTGGSTGGLPGDGGLPGTCTSSCTGCPSGQTCTCPFGDTCGPISSCLIGFGICQ
ncbi:MAG: hypothetical protein ACYCWW_11995 [Deltaproteobacteria bacterium]